MLSILLITPCQKLYFFANTSVLLYLVALLHINFIYLIAMLISNKANY